MQQITDIWFHTKLDLEELAVKIGLSSTSYDYENEWEWIIGSINDRKLDMTRLHSVEPSSTYTRIFILGDDRLFDLQLIDQIVLLLKRISIQPVYLGQWLYRSGQDFDRVIVETKY